MFSGQAKKHAAADYFEITTTLHLPSCCFYLLEYLLSCTLSRTTKTHTKSLNQAVKFSIASFGLVTLNDKSNTWLTI